MLLTLSLFMASRHYSFCLLAQVPLKGQIATEDIGGKGLFIKEKIDQKKKKKGKKSVWRLDGGRTEETEKQLLSLMDFLF